MEGPTGNFQALRLAVTRLTVNKRGRSKDGLIAVHNDSAGPADFIVEVTCVRR